MNANTRLAFILALLGVLFMGTVATFIVPHTYCHGQCKHDARCQERCIKNGCPHWNDTGDQE